MKKKKQKIEFKKAEPRKTLTKNISRLAIVFIIIVGMFLFFKKSHYFRLDNINIIDRNYATGLNAGDLLRIYKGQNIFDIDITSLSTQVKADYPVIKDAIVRRVLPNTIEIDIAPRMPIAKIKSRMYFPIDREGMVLSPEIRSESLPIIIGLSMWLSPKVGTKLKNQQLENAILLIDALKESRISSTYNVTAIDVSNYSNLSFYLENGLEVKIGGEEFTERLGKLKATLANPELDKENIKYIDLRFEDIVIGPK